MFNNELTYHEKWQTDENKKALKKIEKYLSRSECSSDCPLSWAPEVLEFLIELDNELGIARTENVTQGFLIRGNPLTWFLIDPLRAFLYTIRLTLSNNLYFANKSPFNKVLYCFNAYTVSFFHSFFKVKACYINPLLNKILKPKIRLTQLKEKFGSIRFYYSVPPQFVDYVDHKIRDLEIRLAMKGAYFTIEQLWDWNSTYQVYSELNPDIIEIREEKDYRGKKAFSIKKSLYRKQIKDAGVDIGSLPEGFKDD